jgi:arginine:ornithine antiporter/lysine permease
MAAVLESVVGRWGSVFISIGLLISVLGAYLAWTLFAAEVPFMAAKARIMPNFLTRENDNGVPAAALWMTSSLIQVFLIVTLFSQYAFTLALELTSSLSLIPYLLVAAYGLKLAITRETYEQDARNRNKELIICAIATLYSALMIYAGGLKYLLLSALIYAPGTVLFFLARREQNRKIFTFGEWFVFSLAAIAALSALYALVTGRIII